MRMTIDEARRGVAWLLHVSGQNQPFSLQLETDPDWTPGCPTQLPVRVIFSKLGEFSALTCREAFELAHDYIPAPRD